jgi:hypothetical protein
VPIRNILVLQVGQTPLVAGLPQGCRIFNIDECMYLFGGRIETGMP